MYKEEYYFFSSSNFVLVEMTQVINEFSAVKVTLWYSNCVAGKEKKTKLLFKCWIIQSVKCKRAAGMETYTYNDNFLITKNTCQLIYWFKCSHVFGKL